MSLNVKEHNVGYCLVILCVKREKKVERHISLKTISNILCQSHQYCWKRWWILKTWISFYHVKGWILIPDNLLYQQEWLLPYAIYFPYHMTVSILGSLCMLHLHLQTDTHSMFQYHYHTCDNRMSSSAESSSLQCIWDWKHKISLLEANEEEENTKLIRNVSMALQGNDKS